MPDSRIHRSIADRFDLRVQRQPDRLRRWRSRITWLAGLITLAAVCLPVALGNRRIFQSRPVSSSHQLFENDCAACHDRHGQPLVRLLTGSERARSVSDASCRTCHTQTAQDHHAARQPPEHERACAQCHAEHRGRAKLAQVSDAHCVGCHGELRIVEGGQLLPSPNFRSPIRSWHEHPEFAIHREPEGPADREAAFRSDTLPAATALARWDEVSRMWRDRAAFHFNHRFHLDDAGLPLPVGHPEYGDGRARKRLDCASCHEPDPGGAYFRPVSYERHCGACHPLDFSTQLQQIDARQPLSGPLPHVEPRLLRAVLRDRLLAFAEAHPEVHQPTSDVPPPRAPFKPAATPAAVTSKWEWVEQRLPVIEERVFGRADNPQAPLRAGCAQCHHVRPGVPDAEGGAALWTIEPPQIPDRWLPHSRFRHDRHRTLQCVECHYRQPPREEGASLGAAEGILTSTTAADILLPAKITCQKCHGATDRAASGQAADQCVLCHEYHGRSGRQ